MFEDSLLSNAGFEGRSRIRWFVAASLTVQGVLVASVMTAQLLWPAVLPVVSAAPRVASVSLRQPQPKPQPVKPVVLRVTNSQAVRAPAAVAMSTPTVHGGGVLSRIVNRMSVDDGPGLTLVTGMGHGVGTLLGGGMAEGTGPVVRAAMRESGGSSGPLRISSGVSAGLLLTPIRPAYPAIAKAAHVQGTVVLAATIDKAGRITGLQVVSGPEMLRTSAMEAVQAARYRPFLLNGDTTEVVTTVTVVFRMEG